MRKKIYYCYIVFGSIWLQRYCKENYMRKKRIMDRLYLSQYKCEGIAKKIIWGKNVSWLDCICFNVIAKVLQRKLYEEKHIMVRLYLSQYDCEGIANRIIWGKNISRLDCICLNMIAKVLQKSKSFPDAQASCKLVQL